MARFLTILSIPILLGLAGGGAVMYVLHEYGQDLPDYRQLADYEPPVMTRIYAGDGRLLAEYAVEKRVFVPLIAIPQQVIRAFLSAEDKSFYQHSGFDFIGILRATLINIKHYGTDYKPMGGSTITQQVTKNFLLTNEISITRKIKEAILTFRIEKTFSKDHILELYLNEIYLGFGSYGVGAAAMNYFNKSLDELTIAETAFLAALPKAPNNYNPLRNPSAANERRNWVLSRMTEDGYITTKEAITAQNEPLVVRDRADTEFIRDGDHFAEDVRRLLLERYGEHTLYKGGMHVRTTLDPELQEVAVRTLRNGLIEYDRRHGWRGAIGRIRLGSEWMRQLRDVQRPAGLPMEWDIAVVLTLENTRAEIGLADGRIGTLSLSELAWARALKSEQRLGPLVRTASDVLRVGDVIAVELLKNEIEKSGAIYGLRQIPQVEGALVALDPHTGRVLAMVGGFSYERSEFNRATQAWRQPGSAFKPFVYLAALDHGYTPVSVILDTPFVVDQGPGLPKWKPHNYDGSYLGPMTLRLGIEKSRNLVTVRLAQSIGMHTIADYARRFGIVDHLPLGLAMALGAAETTALRMTNAYAMLVNGGKQIHPTIIDRIQDRTGRTIYRHDNRLCTGCLEKVWLRQTMPLINDTRERVTDPLSAYQMVSLLQGVVQYGTGHKVAEIGKPLAGKTGTSNDSMDAWFIGFSPDLAVGVFIGFDEPCSLGARETGGNVAAPVFRDFMREVLATRPATDFRMPPGIRLVRVSHSTGIPSAESDQDAILEAFKPGTTPEGRGSTTVLEGAGMLSENFNGLNNGDIKSNIPPPVPEAGGIY